MKMISSKLCTEQCNLIDILKDFLANFSLIFPLSGLQMILLVPPSICTLIGPCEVGKNGQRAKCSDTHADIKRDFHESNIDVAILFENTAIIFGMYVYAYKDLTS